MTTAHYLIYTANGSLRITKSRPKLKAGEVAVFLRTTIDNAHFVMPVAEAHLTVADEYLIQPEAEVELLPPPVQSSLLSDEDE
jgi:hypothetical protein